MNRFRIRVELRTGLGLEWYLALEYGPVFQYSGGVQAEIFLMLHQNNSLYPVYNGLAGVKHLFIHLNI